MAGESLLIAGGYGVFGALLTRELVRATAVPLIVAGRNPAGAGDICRSTGRVEFLSLDLNDLDAVASAARGCFAVVCAAGPFPQLPRDLPSVCVAAGAHWLDLGDDAGWVLGVVANDGLDRSAAGAGLSVFPGLSTTPTLSGALLQWLVARTPGVSRARITLFIGNRNAKGPAAIASSLQAGFRDVEQVRMPFGLVSAFRHDSADADLWREEMGLGAEFRLAVEWPLGREIMVAASRLYRRLSPSAGRMMARLMALFAGPTSRFGSEGGTLQAEVWDAGGNRSAAALSSIDQRMAILPASLGLEALLRGEPIGPGVVRPASWLTPDAWIDRLTARGLEFATD